MNIDVTGMKSSVHWGCQKRPGGGKSLGHYEHEPQLSLMENKRKYRTKLSCSNTCQGSRTSLMYCCLYYGGVCSEEKCNCISPL